MKMKFKLSKRYLSILLAVVMVVGMLPMTAYAASTEAVTLSGGTGGLYGGDYTYADNLTVYYKYNNYLYEAVFSNMKTSAISKVGLEYSTASTKGLYLDGQKGQYLYKVKNGLSTDYAAIYDLPLSAATARFHFSL